MSLDEVKMKTSSSQLILWMEYLDWKVNDFDKYIWHLAQIAAEIRRPYLAKGQKIRIEDFIHKFARQKSIKKEVPMEVQTRANRMKQFFFGLTGLTGKPKKKKRKKRW